MRPADVPGTSKTIDVLTALHERFGHREFRAGQEQIVAAVLTGRDLLAVMPTGSGKSIGYQLPAVLLPGMTLVVSPLISLMKDQVDKLNRRGIRSGALHSMLSSDDRRDVLHAARSGGLHLLYVAPERFASDQFVRLLADMTIARFVIDEAHCVSEWGHDFRPDYRRLKAAAGACRAIDGRERPPIAAFTATATTEVRDDIVALLGLDSPQVLVAGFDRPNIYFRVERIADEEEKHERLPGLVRGRRALVYAATRRSTEGAAATLKGAGIQAAAYHAGLKDDERTRVQDAFAKGSLPVVCATNAFGMGIDRPDVDAVVHFAIPGSVEAYYQEIGRAGRDGRSATATLLWDFSDVATRQFLIDSPRRVAPGHASSGVDAGDAARRKAIDHGRLQRMVAYAETPACLRATILRYFGDAGVRDPCGSCGNCRPHAIDSHDRALIRTILGGIAESGERYGRRKITAMLVGDTGDLPPHLARLSATGSLRHEESERVDRWIHAAVDAGFIATSQDQYRTLSLTPLGRDIMTGRLDDFDVAAPSRGVQVPSWRRPLHAFDTRRVRHRRFRREW